MWIVECEQQHSSSSQGLVMNGIKPAADPVLTTFRPLMPRPRPMALCSSNAVQFPAITPTTTTTHHHRNPQNPNLTTWKNPPSLISGVCDYGVKKEMIISGGGGVPLVSTRWNPTTEQVQALEEMYRKGTRTPSAEQIQQIAAKLRRLGKIEGKNVFYWFQNHKARERQKKRRREMEAAHLQAAGRKIVRHDHNTTQGTQSAGLNRRHLEIEHPKKLQPTSSNCSTAILQHSATSSSSPVVEELCQKDRWTMQAAAAAKGSTDQLINCCQLDLFSCLSPNNSVDINKANMRENENHPFVEFNLFCRPSHKDGDDLTNGIGKNQILELFPVKAGNDLGNVIMEEGFSNVGTSRLPVAPNQFFEFLPTKN